MAHHPPDRAGSEGLSDTIAAIATAPGAGAIGVVRLSGPAVRRIAEEVIGPLPAPRRAALRQFRDGDGLALDSGLALYFPAPRSFTGEDLLELHGHGGAVVLDLVLARLLALGARAARPGEFSERAFLNGKLDLAQAEAIADLIEAGSARAARLATRSLQGEFSARIDRLAGALIDIRSQIEAAIDFPDEALDLLAEGAITTAFSDLAADVDRALRQARVGRLLRDGIRLVIAGAPNVGKSSLLNRLAGYEAAIVTEIPGTTRDPLRERIAIDGIPVHLVDTAGLRDSDDPIEREGIARTRRELATADLVLWLVDDREAGDDCAGSERAAPPEVPRLIVHNKIDLSGREPALDLSGRAPRVLISARDGLGIDLLGAQIKSMVGADALVEGEFLARRRHLDALARARDRLTHARGAFTEQRALELAAEELRLAHRAFGEITGAFTTEALLGEIFSRFCIGK